MKKILMLSTILTMVLITSCTTRVNEITQKSDLSWAEETVTLSNGREEGVLLYKGKPFSGVLFGLYDQGHLNYEYEYQDGLMHGPSNEYDYDDYLEEETIYNRGVREGSYTQWFENGQIYISGNYTNGKKSGIWTDYDRDGNISRTKEY